MVTSKDTIVFLDAGTLQYGDVSFKALEACGKLVCHTRTTPAQMKSRLKNATTVITNKCVFDAKLLSSLPELKSIHVTATGYNNIDLQAARKSGIAVTNVAGYSTESVVQCTWAFILALAGNLFENVQLVRDGKWQKSPFFTLGAHPVMELAGKTLTVVGYGTIGKRVADVGRAFGMKVLVAKIPGRKYTAREAKSRTPFLAAMKAADIVSVHAPLSPLTQNLIDASVLRKMKKSSFMVNMARGGIVHEKAMANALRRGLLAGAATDVLSTEPPEKTQPLLKAPKLLMTPHVAWASREARMRLIEDLAKNIRAFQRGQKRNRVD